MTKIHSQLRVNTGEDFAKVFYENQCQYHKTDDGKAICMNFFICGFCDKACMRVKKLILEDKKIIDTFIFACHEGGARPDF